MCLLYKRSLNRRIWFPLNLSFISCIKLLNKQRIHIRLLHLPAIFIGSINAYTLKPRMNEWFPALGWNLQPHLGEILRNTFMIMQSVPWVTCNIYCNGCTPWWWHPKSHIGWYLEQRNPSKSQSGKTTKISLCVCITGWLIHQQLSSKPSGYWFSRQRRPPLFE